MVTPSADLSATDHAHPLLACYREPTFPLFRNLVRLWKNVTPMLDSPEKISLRLRCLHLLLIGLIPSPMGGSGPPQRVLTVAHNCYILRSPSMILNLLRII